ncbi:MAG: 1-aminocyclopropane-1-carboxylate deaminase/D-cysteine desulfhydrase [Phycisphaerales bacterium JB043]
MAHHAEKIANVLRDIPHAGFTVEPTPIYRLNSISHSLARNIFVLREDMTGFGLGGNKVRKLDYLIADAVSKGADTLVTSIASSFSRNAAPAATARGLDLHVILNGSEHDHNPLSRSFFERFQTTLHYVDAPSQEDFTRSQQNIIEDIRSRGRNVYEMPPGGSTEIGTLGYIRVFEQIARYSESTGTCFDKIVLPTGSAGTQAGLVLAQCISEYATEIIGVAISKPADVQHERVRKLAESTATMLGTDLDDSNVLVDDRFLGEGYPIPSPESAEAASLFAQSEGILLDLIYGGKAAAWLQNAAATGEIDAAETVLFIHTGGNGGIFY